MNYNGASKQIDRGALKIYLRDLLALECIKDKYRRKLQGVNNTINRLKCKDVYKKYHLNPQSVYLSSQYVHLKYDGKRIMIAYEYFWGGIYVNDTLVKEQMWTWKEIDDDFLKRLKKTSTWKLSSYPFLKFYEGYKERTAARDYYFDNIHYDFKNHSEEWYQENIDTYNYNSNAKVKIKAELDNLNDIIERMYDVNIVPETFRNNIYAIYYIEEFIRTSRESLTTALLHLNLEKIIQRLDRIIEQQEELIIMEAVNNAQNRMLLQSNKNMLERLASIEQNASLAAEYAEIANCNAKASAWIGLANYIKH